MRQRNRTGLVAVVVALVVAVAPAAAQLAPVRVRGLAFDSLRGRPLTDALVMVIGMRGSTTTDANGRFQFDSVAPGVHTFIVQHSALDSVGLQGISRRATVDPTHTDIRLAVPSFHTLWKGACGGAPPDDSGFVYGTIRDVANSAPVANARVDLSWIVTRYDKLQGLRQTRVSGRTLTDAHGGYVVCGVPVATHWLKVVAATASAQGAIDVPPADLRLQRRDLLIGPTAEQDSTSRGTITGVLTDQDGDPFSEARIVLDDSTEVRSDGDGRFAFRNIVAGTRLVEIMSIGMVPIVMVVDVFPADSAAITLQLRRVTTLDVVRVTASSRGRRIAQGIEERSKNAFGYSMDMTEIQAHASLATVMNDFPGVRVDQRGVGDYRILISDGRGELCSPEVWVDGARVGLAAMMMIRPRDVMAVEYFARAGTVPMEFRRTERQNACGAIIVWTHWAFGR